MDSYIEVKAYDKQHIDTIYNILKACGINMAKKFLFHWIPFYSKKAIKNDCITKKVMLVYNNKLKDYTSTFQMQLNDSGDMYVRKIATFPQYEGNGIGRRNMGYMEEYAKANNCKRICLDVYIRSKNAINFYLHNGYNIIGTKRSIRFKELIMEKKL